MLVKHILNYLLARRVTMPLRPRPQSAIASRSVWSLLSGCVFALSLGAAPVAAQTATPPTSALPRGEFEAGLNEVVRQFALDPRFKGVPEQQIRERIEFVAGNLI